MQDGVYEPLALDAPEILAAEQCANELSADIIDGELSDAALWEAYLKVALTRTCNTEIKTFQKKDHECHTKRERVHAEL